MLSGYKANLVIVIKGLNLKFCSLSISLFFCLGFLPSSYSLSTDNSESKGIYQYKFSWGVVPVANLEIEFVQHQTRNVILSRGETLGLSSLIKSYSAHVRLELESAGRSRHYELNGLDRGSKEVRKIRFSRGEPPQLIEFKDRINSDYKNLFPEHTTIKRNELGVSSSLRDYLSCENFETEICLNDISKILSLNRDTIKKILNNVNFNEKISDDEIIESKFFVRENFRKIKKKLIFEIASARIKEIFELILLKNINLKSFAKDIKTVLLEFNVDDETTHLNDIIKEVVLENTGFDFISSKNFPEHSIFEKAGELVHFGWKTEAIPIAQTKKTLIAKFFEAIFD